MSDDRSERVSGPGWVASEIPVFDELRLKGVEWIRLAKIAYTNQFYPSLKSRLTPSSANFPCAYIGASTGTAVAELWGDQWANAKKRGADVFVILKEAAEQLQFLRAGAMPKLRLCDFTDADTRLVIGLDAAAIYSPDLRIPQQWAEMVATHPNNFDGIVYQSLHTNETCAVLWSRPGARDLSAELKFEVAGPFLESIAAYEVAKKIGLKLSWPRGVV